MEVHEAKTRFDEATQLFCLEVWFNVTRENPDFPKKKETWPNLASQEEATKLMWSVIRTYGTDRPYADDSIYENYWDKEPATYMRGWDGGGDHPEPGNEVIIDGFIYYRVRTVGRVPLWVKWYHYAHKYVDVSDEEKLKIKAAGGLEDLYGWPGPEQGNS